PRPGRLREAVPLRRAALVAGRIPARTAVGVPQRARTRTRGRVELSAEIQAVRPGPDADARTRPLHAAGQPRFQRADPGAALRARGGSLARARCAEASRVTGSHMTMIIDCHGHFTTAPKALHAWRRNQLEGHHTELHISDDDIREAIENGQLKLQKGRGGDLTLFSPIAGQMAHHLGTEQTSRAWCAFCTDQIIRHRKLVPENY